MTNLKTGPREYKTLPIANTVVVDSVKYMSEPDGWVAETGDFVELAYFLGHKFEPRCTYLMWSPEGVGRGAHLESRSKLITVVFGLVYFCMVEMRPGTELGKTFEFFLGEGAESLGRSVLVPEGVLNYLVPVGGAAVINFVADKSYNKFDNSRTLDMADPKMGFNLPKSSVQHTPSKEVSKTMSLEEFMKSLK